MRSRPWLFAVPLLLVVGACGDDDDAALPDATTTSVAAIPTSVPAEASTTTSSLFVPETSIPDPACEKIIDVDTLTLTLQIRPIDGVASEGPDGSLTCVYDFVKGTKLEAVTITRTAEPASRYAFGQAPGFTDVQPDGAVGPMWQRKDDADGSVRLFVVIGDVVYEVGVVREGADPSQAGLDPLSVGLANRLYNLHP